MDAGSTNTGAPLNPRCLGCVAAVNTFTSLKVQYAYDTTVASNAFTKGLRLKYVTYPDGREVFRVYDGHDGIDDAIGRPTKVSDGASGTPGSALSQYSYLGNGAIVREDYTTPQVRLDLWGGTSGTYAGLDRFGRVVDQRWHNYNAPADRDRFQYGYDRASNRTYREDSVAATLHDHLYSYDSLHRLIDSQRGTLNGGKDAISTLAFAQQWGLSAVGNWAAFKQDDDGNTTWDLEQTRTHNAANEIASVSGTWITPAYDPAGNMTSGPKATPAPGSESTRHHYDYDAWNRLIGLKADDAGDPGATIATYRYDGLNRRIQRTLAGAPAVVYGYYYNTAWQVLEERKDGSGGPYAQYVWSLRYIDAPIARRRDADGNAGNGLEEVLFYLNDANMNVTALINASGAVVERVTYDAYGRPTFRAANYALQEVSGHDDGEASAYDNPILYCGYRYDPESGTYQVRYRVYQPALGRWVQRDPAEYVDGMALYEYVRSIPVSFLDFLGLQQIASELPPNPYEGHQAISDSTYNTWQRRESRFIGVGMTLTLVDLAAPILARARANVLGGRLLKPHAAEYLSHFLENTGRRKRLNVRQLLQEDDESKRAYVGELNRALAFVEEHFPDIEKSPDRTIVSQEWELVTASDGDWHYALGSYRKAMRSSSIQCRRDSRGVEEYTMVFEYHVADFYDWELGNDARGGLVTDHELAMLHRYGEASEFPVYGTRTVTVGWRRGERFETGAKAEEGSERRERRERRVRPRR